MEIIEIVYHDNLKVTPFICIEEYERFLPFTYKQIKFLASKGYWFLDEPFRFSCNVYGRRYDYGIPRYYILDFASAPKLAGSFLTPTDQTIIRGATIHDFFYENKGFYVFTRENCDELLQFAALNDGMSYLKSRVVYEIVRCRGNKHWGLSIADKLKLAGL